MRKLFTLLASAMLLWTHVLAQTPRTITGKVTDEKGAPLGGVSVTVLGSDRRVTSTAVTDATGVFVVKASDKARLLQFASIGFEEQVTPISSGKAALSIKLTSNAASLADIVVVGYGTQKKKDVTASIASIKGAAIAETPVQSFDQALAGRAAGVQITVPNGVVNNPPVFRIRGTNSLSLSSYPLVVIDGVPTFTGDLSQTNAAGNALGSINPNDIESMDILKDAAATAIYGSRAANGVVIITTKKGKPGKTKVTYDGWVGWSKAFRLPKMLNADQYMAIKNEGLTNANQYGTGAGQIEFLPTNGPNGKEINTNWNDYIYRTGISTSHALSFSGGNDATTYYFSMGFTKQAGIIVKNDYTRVNVRFNIDHKLNKYLSIGANMAYANELNAAAESTGSLSGQAYNTSGLGRLAVLLPPNISPYNNDGTYSLNGNSIGVMNNTISSFSYYNPLPIINNDRGNSENNHIQGNAYAMIKPVKGVTFKTTFGADYLMQNNEIFQNIIQGDAYGTGSATSTYIGYKRWTWSNTLQYDLTIKRHTVGVLGGIEQQGTNTNGFGLNRTNVSDPFYTTIQGGWTTNNTAGLSYGVNYLYSQFARLTYDFGKKYFLSGVIRRDGYSGLPAANKYGSFWGVSGSWDVTKERFFASLGISNVLSSFKLRGSYGTVGNISGIADFSGYSFYGSGLYNGAATLAFSTPGNSNLKWETSKKTDLGVNFGLFKDILTGEFAYYFNDINGLILSVPQAPSTGLGSLSQNVGSMYNKGYELTLNATPINKKHLTWTTSFNISYNANKVTSLYPGLTSFTTATSSLETVSLTQVGLPTGYLTLIKTAGVDPANGRRMFVTAGKKQIEYTQVPAAGQSKWTYTDGTTAPAIASTDQVPFGNTNPKYYGGFDNTVHYKDFDFNLLITYQAGFWVYNGTQATIRDQRFWNSSVDILRRWQKAGDVTDIPRIVYGDNVSNGSANPLDINAQKGDFIKFRNLTVGYTIPARLLEKAKIGSIRVYVSAQNLGIITKYTGPDPEVSSNGNGNNNQGVDRNTIGNARTYTVGLNVGL